MEWGKKNKPGNSHIEVAQVGNGCSLASVRLASGSGTGENQKENPSYLFFSPLALADALAKLFFLSGSMPRPRCSTAPSSIPMAGSLQEDKRGSDSFSKTPVLKVPDCSQGACLYPHPAAAPRMSSCFQSPPMQLHLPPGFTQPHPKPLHPSPGLPGAPRKTQLLLPRNGHLLKLLQYLKLFSLPPKATRGGLSSTRRCSIASLLSWGQPSRRSPGSWS